MTGDCDVNDVDVRGWDWLTDLGPLIFWLLYVN